MTLLKEREVWRVTGRDHRDFFQRLSTQDFRKPPGKEVLPCAFLNANGTVVALFYVWEESDALDICVHKSFSVPFLQFLDRFHFGEDLKWERINEAWLEVRGEKLTAPDDQWRSVNDGFGQGYFFRTPTPEVAPTPSGWTRVSEEELDFLRLQAGVPSAAHELTTSNIILEGPFDLWVVEGKGCYPGQEVIERIRSYGNVAKVLRPTARVLGMPISGESIALAEGENLDPVGTVNSVRSWQGNNCALLSIKRLRVTKDAEFLGLSSQARLQI